MKQLSIYLAKHSLKIIMYGAIGSFLMLLIVLVVFLNNQADLSIWHTTHLDEEYTAKSEINSFDDYRQLEERLFKQLDKEIYKNISESEKQAINRYHTGSLSDPNHQPINWNRSYEMPVKAPQAGILLIHGLSDSPYSLKSLAQGFNRSGAWVVGLRLPGHGTAPSGLVHMQWQDMTAAVKLAMRHLKSKVRNQPVYIVGYSTGGALAVQYVLQTLDDPELPEVQGIMMTSPAIGVPGIAVLAKWQARLGYLLGLEKLQWNSVLPEYDPYKYGSFAVIAGEQVYRLTQEIQSLLEQHSKEELKKIPPILAFQSVVDNTVSTPALVGGLFSLLPDNGHELVLFDINRSLGIDFLLKKDPANEVRTILQQSDNTFTLSFLTNKDKHSNWITLRQRKAGEVQVLEQETRMVWPKDIYSLSHLALAIPADDPIYGSGKKANRAGVSLGNLALRGEAGVLQISAKNMLRLRWNPFYSYIEKRMHQFTQLKRVTEQSNIKHRQRKIKR